MFARVSTFEGPPSRIDEFMQQADHTVERIRELSGFLGLDVLVNRETGKILTITLWDSMQSMEDSTEAANRLRSEGIEPERGDQPPTFEVYERALQYDNRKAGVGVG